MTRREEFGNFVIEYEVTAEKTMVEAKFWHMPQQKEEPLGHLTVKWDGCSHLRLPYLHFDGLDAYQEFSELVRYIYEDVCDREGVGETGGN